MHSPRNKINAAGSTDPIFRVAIFVRVALAVKIGTSTHISHCCTEVAQDVHNACTVVEQRFSELLSPFSEVRSRYAVWVCSNVRVQLAKQASDTAVSIAKFPNPHALRAY